MLFQEKRSIYFAIKLSLREISYVLYTMYARQRSKLRQFWLPLRVEKMFGQLVTYRLKEKLA